MNLPPGALTVDGTLGRAGEPTAQPARLELVERMPSPSLPAESLVLWLDTTGLPTGAWELRVRVTDGRGDAISAPAAVVHLVDPPAVAHGHRSSPSVRTIQERP
jgi:hypothetical protein